MASLGEFVENQSLHQAPPVTEQDLLPNDGQTMAGRLSRLLYSVISANLLAVIVCRSGQGHGITITSGYNLRVRNIFGLSYLEYDAIVRSFLR